jgi:branched-chain amino acid transport system permease protein
MENFLQATYSGIILGSIYALMAMGFTLTFGAMRFLNLALGSLFTLGGYIAWLLASTLGLNPILGILAAFVGAALVGMGIHGVVIRPMIGKPGWEMATIIATLGVGIVLENALLVLFGPRNKSIPQIASGGFVVGDLLRVQHQHLVIFGVALLVLGLMGLFLDRSRHGLAIRAIAQNIDAAYLAGVPVRRMFLFVTGIAGGLAAVAGVLLSAFYFLSPTVGLTVTLKALVVTIFGGLGSIPGTLYAAFIIGLLEAYVIMYFGARWALPFLFVFLILVLVIRPSGLAGVSSEAQV